MRYVVHKRSRGANIVLGSYMGIAWQNSGVGGRYKPFYTNLGEAIYLAWKLSQSNPVGFQVTEV
jgi:hypothetical protein